MTLGSTSTQAYGEPSYWDNRYVQDPGPFDWYQKYPSLAPLLHLYVQDHHQILVVGCGNAALSEEMVKDGYDHVINIDISSVVIDAMQRRSRDRPQLTYIKMDVRDMNQFESSSFDAVIDKGTLDSLMCGSNSQQNAVAMLEEVGRVLKHGGVYILITYGAPVYRLSLLRDPCFWTIKLHVIGDGFSRIFHVLLWIILLSNVLSRIPILCLVALSNVSLSMPNGDHRSFQNEKFVAERSSGRQAWELTKPVPVNDDGSSVDTILGRNPEVHYIYVCTKVGLHH
ncbi:hypothetical protein IFM89_004378 [Coptis chinensis]|uniref:Methyltransferase type 11 domain-containing protein n=1 Tax=Coptis chinensis TaxID=261450 RepID=A0A835IKT9_9MAGN|nr:hypothetical protein IFM89_004378 [Coptis chinensis]